VQSHDGLDRWQILPYPFCAIDSWRKEKTGLFPYALRQPGVDSLVFCHSHNAHDAPFHYRSPVEHKESSTQPAS
jgi:hypothetical protein